jgi:chromosome partitioning protein
MQADQQKKNPLRIIAMLGQKGGPGKTTLAVHLAVAAQEDGEIVTMADTDPQASAYKWVELREAKDPPVAQIRPKDLNRVISIAEQGNASLMIIDTAPHASLGAYDAIARADLVIMPCRPTRFDLATIEAAVSIAEASRRKGAFVLNQCSPQGTETESTRAVLQSYGFPVAPMTIGLRKAYARATDTGRAVTEFDPRGVAAEEIREFWQWTKEMLNC